MGGQFRRTSALDGIGYVANGSMNSCRTAARSLRHGTSWRLTRNNCHTRLSLHGDIRRDVKLCILCHNPDTTDANSGNNLDMRVMVHKIHMGGTSQLPYQIYGYRDTLHDYSEVVYPQDIRNCTSCHDQGEDCPGDYYLTADPRGLRFLSRPYLVRDPKLPRGYEIIPSISHRMTTRAVPDAIPPMIQAWPPYWRLTGRWNSFRRILV